MLAPGLPDDRALERALGLSDGGQRGEGQAIFRHRGGARRKGFVGTVCRVQTGRVSEGFGQATVEDGGAGLVIPVRIDAGELKRGDQALIVDYDAEREAYIIEAYDDSLKEDARR